MSPAISIILPVYNVEKYLADCLESVLQQDYQDYEIIAVNDGSVDSSLAILESYKSKFNDKLTIISIENQGQSNARNLGVSKSNGTFIYFLDSDDLIRPNTLSSCIYIFEKYNIDLVMFDAEAFYDEIELEDASNYDYHRNIEQGYYSCEELFAKFIKTKYIVSPCCYMLKKSSYLDIQFPLGIWHEDNYFTTKLLSKNGTNAYILNKVLFERRVRPLSIMTQPKTQKHADGYFTTSLLLNDELKNHKKNTLTYSTLKKYIRYLFVMGVQTQNQTINKNSILNKLNQLAKLRNLNYKLKLGLFILFPYLYNRVLNLKNR